MLALVLLAALGIVGWAGWSGRLGADPARKVGISVGALLSIYLLARGQQAPGLGLAAATAAYWLAGMLRTKRGLAPMDIAEARQVLGLAADADEAAVRAAHRRLIAQVHPDAGGSADLARRVNAARDALLAAKSARR